MDFQTDHNFIIFLFQFTVVLALACYMTYTSASTLPALRHEEIHDSLGQYALRYVTSDGTVVEQRGKLVPSDGGLVLVSEGETKYVGDDGRVYKTKYTAGLDGYKVEGDHLPKTPELIAA